MSAPPTPAKRTLPSRRVRSASISAAPSRSPEVSAATRKIVLGARSAVASEVTRERRPRTARAVGRRDDGLAARPAVSGRRRRQCRQAAPGAAPATVRRAERGHVQAQLLPGLRCLHQHAPAGRRTDTSRLAQPGDALQAAHRFLRYLPAPPRAHRSRPRPGRRRMRSLRASAARPFAMSRNAASSGLRRVRTPFRHREFWRDFVDADQSEAAVRKDPGDARSADDRRRRERRGRARGIMRKVCQSSRSSDSAGRTSDPTRRRRGSARGGASRVRRPIWPSATQ